MMKSFAVYLYFPLIFLISVPRKGAALFYPASSLLQLTASVSVPVEEYFPERRIIVDWCFQMNYDLPFNVSSFYNIPIWPGKYSAHRTRRAEEGKALHLNRSDEPPGIRSLHGYEKYGETNAGSKNRHPSDFTAGEFYQAMEDVFVSYGIHETCLLRSVCDLAQHPFDDDVHRNILTEALTYLLSPSMHRAFDASEQIYREVYEAAEQRGFMGQNCQQLFEECQHDILGSITEVMYLNG